LNKEKTCQIKLNLSHEKYNSIRSIEHLGVLGLPQNVCLLELNYRHRIIKQICMMFSQCLHGSRELPTFTKVEILMVKQLKN